MSCAGLLGGAVYVNAFTLISRHVDPLMREFSLAAASLGDSLGIAFADVAGVLIQVSACSLAAVVNKQQFILASRSEGGLCSFCIASELCAQVYAALCRGLLQNGKLHMSHNLYPHGLIVF